MFLYEPDKTSLLYLMLFNFNILQIIFCHLLPDIPHGFFASDFLQNLCNYLYCLSSVLHASHISSAWSDDINKIWSVIFIICVPYQVIVQQSSLVTSKPRFCICCPACPGLYYSVGLTWKIPAVHRGSSGWTDAVTIHSGTLSVAVPDL